MPTFVDPRTAPLPPFHGTPRPPAQEPEEVDDLIKSIVAGRFFEVERWIQTGRPLQFRKPENRRKRHRTPLRAALETGQHDIVHLLLCNGYQTEQEQHSPFDAAVRKRRRDLVDLLLAWGADPATVTVYDLLESYDRELYVEFWSRGVDLTQNHELACVLAESAGNKPLYGFMKRHVSKDPGLKTELDLGLNKAVEWKNAKAVSLSMWAGADPWASVPDLDCRQDEIYWWDCAAARAVMWDRIIRALCG